MDTNLLCSKVKKIHNQQYETQSCNIFIIVFYIHILCEKLILSFTTSCVQLMHVHACYKHKILTIYNVVKMVIVLT